jgi:O-antigen ligase
MVHFLYLIALVVILIRPQEIVPGLAAVPLVQYVLLPAVLAWLGTDRRPLELPTTRWLLLFALAAYLSVGVNGWWGGASQVVEELLPPIAMFLLTAAATRNEKQFRRFAWTLCACAMVLVYHGHQQRTLGVGFTGETPVQDYRIRYIGILGDPNDLGMLFCVALGLSVYLYASTGAFILRVTAAAIFAAIIYGIYLTDSRGTMLGCLAAIALVMSWRFGRVATVTSLVLAVPTIWASTRLATVSADDDSAEGRVDAWSEGLQMLKESPLFGVGFQGFTDYHELTAHNSLVLVMAETGLLGYVPWFAFILSAAYLAVGAMKDQRQCDNSTSEARAARYVVVICFAVAICAMFLSQSYKVLFLMVAGLAVGRWLAFTDQGASMEPSDVVPAASRLSLYAVASIVFMWLLVRILA